MTSFLLESGKDKEIVSAQSTILMLIVSLFRDLITVNQYPGVEFNQGIFSFRLPQNFWTDSKTQRSVLFEMFSFLEGEFSLHLASNGDLLPSSLSPNFSEYILFSSNISKLSSEFTDIFDKVIERSFTNLEPFFDKLEYESYLYIDYDVDKVGFFCATGRKKLGGYLELSFHDYLENGLEEFFTNPWVLQNSKSMTGILNLMLQKVQEALGRNGVNSKNIRKAILGGVYKTYFDTIALNTLDNWNELFDFEIIEKDSNYRILCENLW